LKSIIEDKNITINDRQYQLITYQDGTSTLKRFNEKHKMWVTVNFSNKIVPEIDIKIQETLSQNFLTRISTSIR
jgi:hypothetical protein